MNNKKIYKVTQELKFKPKRYCFVKASNEDDAVVAATIGQGEIVDEYTTQWISAGENNSFVTIEVVEVDEISTK